MNVTTGWAGKIGGMLETIGKAAGTFDLCFGFFVVLILINVLFAYAGRRWPKSYWPAVARGVLAGVIVGCGGRVLFWLIELLWRM